MDSPKGSNDKNKKSISNCPELKLIFEKWQFLREGNFIVHCNNDVIRQLQRKLVHACFAIDFLTTNCKFQNVYYQLIKTIASFHVYHPHSTAWFQCVYCNLLCAYPLHDELDWTSQRCIGCKTIGEFRHLHTTTYNKNYQQHLQKHFPDLLIKK